MGFLDEHSLLSNMTGKIGRQIYVRHVNGKAVMQLCPVRKKGPYGPKMPETNMNFLLATRYASHIRKTNPELTALYASLAAGFKSASSVAISDYLKHPVIKYVDLQKYKGAQGNVITIEIENIIRVRNVIVQIDDAEGNKVEMGMADITRIAGSWQYRVRNNHPDWKQTSISVTATDFPGHSATKIAHCKNP